MQSLAVNLHTHSYSIHTGRGLSGQVRSEANQLQTKGHKVAVVTDANIVRTQNSWLLDAFGNIPTLILPPGETTKSFAHLQSCCEFFAEHKLDRNSAVFAFGGGVIGDLTGFAAAVFLRGISFYQIPTTLLAMVDSSVGGKTGINIPAGKNLVGAFQQPKAVFADVNLLNSLPEREFSAGMAEVIKHGMLADSALFEILASADRLHPDHPDMAGIIRRNCSIKASIVQADERETAKDGGRALLNLGHTFGHAIEAVAGYGTLLHGEAVAIGLLLATKLSVALQLVDHSNIARVEHVLSRYNLPIRLPSPLSLEELMLAMTRDKKVRSGTLRFVGLRALGEACTIDSVNPNLVRDLWLESGAVSPH